MNDNMSNKWYKNDIAWTAIVIFLFLIGFVAIDVFVFNKSEITSKNDNIIIVPDNDSPNPPFSQMDIKLTSTENLLTKPYIPSQDVYTNNYNKDVVKLALSGKFKIAKFEVEGEVFGEGLHFVSLNFEKVSGVLNASRKSNSQLDFDKTKTFGGVFVKSIPIKFIVDLKSETVLAKTRGEFIEGQDGSKKVILWNFFTLDTPTVVKFLFAPFNEYGQYGGARITSIKFQYLCEAGENCGAFHCPSTQMTTECLSNSFSRSAAVDWCKRAKLDECKGFN